jgi:hypothetical protein
VRAGLLVFLRIPESRKQFGTRHYYFGVQKFTNKSAGPGEVLWIFVFGIPNSGNEK